MFELLHAQDGPYRFHWTTHADVVLLCIFLLVGYWYAVTQLRGAVSDAGRVRRSQVLFFTAGVASIYLVAGTPVHDISEGYLLSAHMLQHTVFTMVAAPLLLAGIPAWLWEALFRVRGVKPVARVVLRPLVAFAIFNALILVTHLPGPVDLALTHHWFHFLVHAALIVSAMLMWWQILSVVPEFPRLSAPLQMAYLFVQSILPTVVASFITFADGAVYPFYAEAPRMWGLSAVEDQQIAGGIMKLTGSLILWSFIAVVFFQWYAREQAQDQEPRWDEVQGELDRLGLTGGAGEPPRP